MNVVKYYRERGGGVAVKRIRITQNESAATGIAGVDSHMLKNGFTRRPPVRIKPHSHPHQQPGYRQPSEQQLRRARQVLQRRRAA